MHLHAFPVRPDNDYRYYWLPEHIQPPESTEQLMAATFAEMKRLNVVKGWASGPMKIVSSWKNASPDTILAAALYSSRTGDWSLPDVQSLRREYESRGLDGLGELVAQLAGLTQSDPYFEPYFDLAEELDIPTSIHTGFPPPGWAYTYSPLSRASLGSPFGAEDALLKHRDLRVYIAHGGYPFLGETIAFLHAHPQVYVDISEINWLIPREEFHEYLRRLMISGFGKRLMFGSDQMYWPSAIERSIEAVDSAPFLSDQEKQDIFYDNAARFLRLSEEEIAKHHEIAGR
jgi:predicted TIM-barrel fold metal-dependent hydrolase